MCPADRYRAAGVDLAAASRAKARIIQAVEATRTDLAVGSAGGFGGMVRIPRADGDQVLVMSTDGVGTKVLVAVRAGVHHTVGLDLVNHCVNDILVHGARPVAFQDYVAAADLDEDTLASLVEGVARGCRDHQMVLTGGETAQMPDLYPSGHYDLAGTIAGLVAQDEMLDGSRIEPGDKLVAYRSSGLHTNGYSLARNILFERMELDLDDLVPGLDQTVGEALLAVHSSYFGAVFPVLNRINGLAHVTGGGIPGNLGRVLPDGCGARLDPDSWEVPQLFTVLREGGDVSREEMFEVFNMGVGMLAAVSPSEVDRVMEAGADAGADPWVAGEVVRGQEIAFS